MARVLIATSDRDFDPTEVAVPWQHFIEAGHEVHFATGSGLASQCDNLTLLGPPQFSRVLTARPQAISAYNRMEKDARFRAPLAYSDVRADQYDALLLPGGHAPAMRQYLEDRDLQRLAVDFDDQGRIIGAICHGPVVLARAQRADGSSLLSGRRVTALTWLMEMSAWLMTVTRLGSHYRTYPTPVQTEVKAAGCDWVSGPLVPIYGRAFVVRDDNLITARWPGDSLGLAEAITEAIAGCADERLLAK